MYVCVRVCLCVCVCMFVSNMFVCMRTYYVRSCPTGALLGLTQCEMKF